MPHRIAVCLAITMIYGGIGCASQQPAGTLPARPIERLKRVRCEGESERLTDANADGWADLRRVFAGERELCSEADLNFDLHIDTTRVFDEQAQLTLEQLDLDFDGRIDQQSTYEQGKLARKELDTNFDRMTDTWLWCDGQYLGRLERDRAKQGRVDTWEDYRGGLLSAARYDDDHDGKPERWEVYDKGVLLEVKEDNDGDGQPDRSTKVADADAAAEPMSCDAGWMKKAGEPAKPPARASDASTGASKENSQ